MKIDLDDLRRLYRDYVAGQRPGRRCPPEAELFRFFEPKTSRRKKAAILHHVTSCSCCAELFEILVYSNKRSTSMPNPADAKARPTNRLGTLSPPILRWAATLLGVGLIFTSVVVLWHDQGFRLDVHRSSSETLIRLIRPVGRVPAGSAVVFEWIGFSGIDHYRVDLFDETLLRIWQSPKVESAPLRLPPEVRGLLRSDQSYFWMVTAISQAGRVIESPLQKFVPAGSIKR